jgi:predicted nucleic acid-binding protein
MARVRKIERSPIDHRNYFLVDASFFANKHIPAQCAPPGLDRDRIVACHHWWKEIDEQADAGLARVYVPDLCIAEAFKVLAKKYYAEKWFKTSVAFSNAKSALSADVRTSSSTLRALNRNIKYHDISTNRDIIISVDRFFELFTKHKKNVQIADLILVSTAKYLMDFYDIPKPHLHIVTLDNALREGIAKVAELPSAYDPTRLAHRAEVVFD